MYNPFRIHNGFWTSERKRSMWLGVFLLVLAVVVQILIGSYSARAAVGAGYAHDLFLDNLPTLNLDFVIVGGGILFWALYWWLLAVNPRKLIFGTKAAAFFVAIRAFFTSLTHVGAYPVANPPGPNNFGWGLYHLLTYQGNFFFSGHTALPFLMALLFWEDVPWRYFFLMMTVVFGATMLFSHEHYSIDVFAAPFIVYGIYRITEKLFPKDAAIMESKKETNRGGRSA
jgi:hypothetical protein